MKLALFGFLLALPAQAAQHVAVIVEGQPGGPARYGIARLEQSLKARGLEVADAEPGARIAADYAVVARLEKGGPESLAIRRSRYQEKPALILSGGDSRGLMYAALEAADRIRDDAASADPFASIRQTAEQPYLAGRGVSMYTMQRAYFESRLYDEKQWERYFDLLAGSRINNFILIFGY